MVPAAVLAVVVVVAGAAWLIGRDSPQGNPSDETPVQSDVGISGQTDAPGGSGGGNHSGGGSASGRMDTSGGANNPSGGGASGQAGASPDGGGADAALRPASGEGEEFAVRFVELCYNLLGHSGWAYYDDGEEAATRAGWLASIAEMAEPESLSPAVPSDGSVAALGNLVVRECLLSRRAYSYDGREFARGEIHDYNDLWYREEGKVVGVVSAAPSKTHAGATSVEMLLRNTGDGVEENSKEYSVLAEVIEKGGRYYLLPAPVEEIEKREPFDAPVRFEAPANARVTFRGDVLAPAVEGGNVYELEGMYPGVAEEVQVWLGEEIGAISCLIRGDPTTYGYSDEGSGYASYGMTTDIMAHAVTKPEFRAARDEIIAVTDQRVQQIGVLLNENNYDGLADITCNPNVFTGGRGLAPADRSRWVGYFTTWARNDRDNPMADVVREVTVNKITVPASRNYRVEFTTVLVLPSGRRYTADSVFTLYPSDGEWKIWYMTTELFTRSTDTWKLLDD
jgi:hypothetical protein